MKHILRSLRRSPGFTLTVVLTLGLGIGANAAMFGVLDRLMLRPFPYLREPGTVHKIYLQRADRDRVRTYSAYEYTRYLDLRRWTSSFTQFAAVSNGTMPIGSGDAARERTVGRVSAEFWRFFDARPAAGRFFTDDEDKTPIGAPVVVLSWEFWQSEYGGEDVLGRMLQVGPVQSTIIGVTPRGFVGIAEGEPPAVYMPITTYAGTSSGPNDRVTYYTRYNWGWLQVIARRKPGVSVEAASADAGTAHVKSWDANREFEPQLTPTTLARPAAIVGPVKTAAGPEAGLEAKTIRWVSGVAAIVLLIACANVANLMFARVLRRRREIAVRLALGVSRSRLAFQTLLESLVLGTLAAVAGVVIAQTGGAVLRRLVLPAGVDVGVVTDPRTLLVVAVCALGAAILTAAGPALLAVRRDFTGDLKASAREGTYQRSRLRTTLLVMQGALSVVLLVGAGLFVRSLDRVREMRLGYDTEPMLVVMRSLRGMALSDTQSIALSRSLLETAQRLPGVEHAAVISSLPFWSTSSTGLYVPGIDSTQRLGRFTYQTGSPDYFKTMGTRIVRGRPFTDQDRAGTPLVGVVSEAMAATLWPGQDPLGRCMKVGADTMPCTTVIGIAEDAVQNSLTDDQRMRYYLPLEQFRPVRGSMIAVRMRGDADVGAQVEPVRKALQAIMPGESYVTVRPLAEIVDRQRRSWEFGATMFVAFGGLALLVAAVGLYGVITYSVAQRMHELGVRIALGAQRGDVLRLVIGQGLRFAVAGLVVGLALAVWAAKWLEPLLFQQPARDPAILAIVAVLLLVVAIVASAQPAVRATRADPNSALRAD